MILFVFNFCGMFIDWDMKLVHSVHLCHVFQYLSDRHIKKKKMEKQRDTNSQQERKYDNIAKFVFRRFPIKFLLLTGIAEDDSCLEPITVKRTTRYSIVWSSTQRPRVKVYRSYRTYQPNTFQLRYFGILFLSC